MAMDLDLKKRIVEDTGSFRLTMGRDATAGSFFASRAVKKKLEKGFSFRSILYALGLLLLMAASTDSKVNSFDGAPKAHKIMVTAYTNVPGCTDSTPDETASLLRIRPKHYGKVIALSRDLAKSYKFGDKFRLWINGKPHLVEYQDLMAEKHSNRIDLLLPTVKKCKVFGKKEGLLIPLGSAEQRKDDRAG